MFGRERELARLHDFLLQVSDGRKRILLLHGPEGVGKTTLLNHSVHDADGRGIRAIKIRASHHIFPTLQDLCARIAEGTQTAAGDSSTVGKAVAWRALTEATALWRLTELLEASAEVQPVVIAIDDLDHLSADRVDLLFEAFRVAAGSLGMVATMTSLTGLQLNTHGLTPSTDLWMETLPLEGLDRSAFGAMAESMLGASLSPSSLARVHELCTGNPLLGGELLHHLMLNGNLGMVGAVLVLDDLTLDPDNLPQSLIDAFTLRLHSLSELQATIMQLLSLVGKPLALNALHDLCGPGCSRAVAVLETRRLIRSDGAGLRVTHPLYEHAILAQLSPLARAQLHARVLAWLEKDKGAWQSSPERLAFHAVRSQVSPSRAAHLLSAAAYDAMGEGRFREAVQLFSQARALDPRQADEAALIGNLAHALEFVDPSAAAEHYRQAIEKVGEQASLLLGLASALRKQGEFGAALDVLSKATPTDQGSSFEISRAVGVIHAIRGDREKAVATFQELISSAKTDDERARAEGHLAQAYFLSAQEQRGHALAQAAFTRVKDPAVQAHMANNLGWMKIILGQWAQADELLTAATATTAKASDHYHLGALLTIHARLAAWQGSIPESLERSSRAVLLTKALRNPADIIGALDSLALSLLEAGRVKDAQAILPTLEAHVRAELEPREITLTFVIAGDVCLAAGALDQATIFADMAADHLQEAEHLIVAERRLRAEVELRSGRPDTAFSILVSVKDDAPFVLERANALAVMAQAQSLLNMRSESLVTADKALSAFRSLGARSRSKRVEEWLSRHQPTPRGRPRSGGPQDLTQREREVLWLVTRGLTSREISHSLFISEGTVNKHIDNIKKKAGVSRRTELVTFAVRLGIVPETAPAHLRK